MTNGTTTNAIWFTPQAIREHFEGGESPLAKWVTTATDQQLQAVGEIALDWDGLWQEFHLALSYAAGEVMKEARQ